MSKQVKKLKIKEINKFNIRIFDAVLRLLPQLSPDAELPTKKHFKRILKSGSTHLFIAELGKGKIVGMLTIGIYDIPSGTRVWIEDVVVDDSQRGKGFGKELTLFAIDFAKSLGAESVGLTSRPSRIAANQLYQRLGFVRRETNVYMYNLK